MVAHWHFLNNSFESHLDEEKAKTYYVGVMDEGRKRILGIIAGILVARHLKTIEDLFDTRGSPRTRSMATAAVQWAERIMQKVDNVIGDEKVKS